MAQVIEKVVIGDATLYRGDCLDVMRSMPSASVDAVITDPPYGIDYQSARRTDKSQWKPKIANDGQPFIWWLHDAARLLRESGALICFCRWDVQDAFKQAIVWSGLTIKAQVIWDRESHGMGDLTGSPSPQHDVIWFATPGGFKFANGRPSSVIRSIRLPGEALTHPNEKPIDLMCKIVRDYTSPGHIVFDPFMGSGVAGEACAKNGRAFVGCEIDATYFERDCRRISDAQNHLFAKEPA